MMKRDAAAQVSVDSVAGHAATPEAELRSSAKIKKQRNVNSRNTGTKFCHFVSSIVLLISLGVVVIRESDLVTW